MYVVCVRIQIIDGGAAELIAATLENAVVPGRDDVARAAREVLQGI